MEPRDLAWHVAYRWQLLLWQGSVTTKCGKKQPIVPYFLPNLYIRTFDTHALVQKVKVKVKRKAKGLQAIEKIKQQALLTVMVILFSQL